MSSSSMFSESEAAAFVSKSVSTLRLFRRQGKGPAFFKIGRTPRYSQDDLVAWMHANRVAPGA